MNNFNEALTYNFKKIRESRNLSLEKVSKLTGVSRSMLGQIDRGEANPSIGIVWKIANGLKVSFTSLIQMPLNEYEVIDQDAIESMIEDEGRYRLYPFFPFEVGRGFESYKVEIDPKGQLMAESHGDGVQEFITVYKGKLLITFGYTKQVLKQNQSIRFDAGQLHAYENIGDDTLVLNMIIYYPDNV